MRAAGGCAAGSITPATITEHVRETVREKYAAAARAAAARVDAGCCSPADRSGAFGSTLYTDSSEAGAPEAAVSASLGCGVPTAVADLHEGEIVLDLGSGAGADVLISNCVINLSGDKPRVLADAGLQQVEIQKTHRVHEHAAAAIIRARKSTRR